MSMSMLRKTTDKQRHFIITREFDSPTTFYEKYRPQYWQLKEAMEDGNIATYNINGRNHVKAVEAIRFLWPNATYEIVAPVNATKNLFD
jgi:hypothetical protein